MFTGPQLGSDDNVANVDSSEESGIAKMESSRKTSTSTCSSGEHSSSDLSPADMHGMWYPTLRRTLVCLSKLYRCLDIEIFRGLAQVNMQTNLCGVSHCLTKLICNSQDDIHSGKFINSAIGSVALTVHE